MEAILRITTFVGQPDKLSVHFTGPDGRTVSVAFDARCDRTDIGDGTFQLCEYPILRDAPVMLDDRTVRPVADLPALLLALASGLPAIADQGSDQGSDQGERPAIAASN